MKQSYSASTVWSRLDTAINQNNAAVAELNHAANDVAAARSSKAEIYQQLMQEFVTNILSPFNNEKLSQIDRKYADRYKDIQDESAEAEAAIDNLIKRFGPIADVPSKLHELRKQEAQINKTYEVLRVDYNDIAGKLDPVWFFDHKAAQNNKPQLTAESIPYFSSKTGISGFFARIFDSHYKQGRSLISSFKKDGVTIPDLQRKFVEQKKILEEHKTASVKNADEINLLKNVPDTFSRLAAKHKTETNIQVLLIEEIITDARAKSTFDVLTSKFPEAVPEYLVEVRAKMDAYDKLEANAREQAKQLKEMAKPIESKLPNLKSAARKPGATVKDVDLDAIENTLKQARENAKKNAEQVKKTKGKVNDYDRRYDTSTTPLDVVVSALDIYTDIMIYDMLLDLSDGKLDGHGGFGDFLPSLGSALSAGGGISDVFNSISFDQLDISETLSKIELPDVGGFLSDIGNSVGDIFDGGFDFD